MSHPGDEALLDVFLGEATDREQLAHVETCAECRAVLASYERSASAVRTSGAGEVAFDRPPGEVWDRIADELGMGQRAPTPRESPAVLLEPRRVPDRPSRWVSAALGFAVGIAATVAGVVVVHQLGTSPGPRVVARARVTPFEGRGSTAGQALVLEQGQARSVRVEVTGEPLSPDTFVEAWLLDPRTNAMLSLGVVRSSDQTFAIPDDLDLDAYTSVDISLEPMNGDPAHSADSLARGALQPVG